MSPPQGDGAHDRAKALRSICAVFDAGVCRFPARTPRDPGACQGGSRSASLRTGARAACDTRRIGRNPRSGLPPGGRGAEPRVSIRLERSGRGGSMSASLRAGARTACDTWRIGRNPRSGLPPGGRGAEPRVSMRQAGHGPDVVLP